MKYDIIVIGAGSAGLNVASFMNTIGLKVLLVEKGLIGGDCLNYGCVPSKALISMAHTIRCAQLAGKFGIHPVGSLQMDKVADTIRQRQDFIRVHENAGYFRGRGIDVEIGSPEFTAKNTIKINDRECTARRIVIATGSRPALPPIEGLDRVDYLTNETIFANRQLPKKLLVIGGGPIGIEMAQAYQQLGSQVTVLVRGRQILPKEDTDIAGILLRVLQDEGMDIRLGFIPVRFPDPHTLVVQQYDKQQRRRFGEEIVIHFDRVLIATGRKLNVEGLNLKKAGVEVQDGKIRLDQTLRTSNKRIYCGGDVAGDYLFTHWAEYQAAVVINNMLSPFKKKVDRSRIAWVTYTDPEVASFGRQGRSLDQEGIKYKTVEIELKEVDRAICEGIEAGKLKLHLSKGKIIGGTMIARNAGELSGELISAMTLGIPFANLYNRIFPYPTMARINRRAVQKHLGQKLTPRNKTILNRLYKLLN